MVSRYCAASVSWSLVPILYDWVLPLSEPLGALTLVWVSALRSDSMVRPMFDSCAGLTWMRTAGRTLPAIDTRPTPGTCDRRWARIASA